ncbi:MAG: Gfo/Idh/MocA family protein, partial [Candidatus Acidiferrales bacterium]
MSTQRISRRNFMRVTAGGVALAGAAGSTTTLAARTLPARARAAVPPSDRVGLAIVGVGMQGSGLLKTALSLPGVECVGAAELYDGRARLAKEIAGKEIFVTRDYRELLARADVDAVIVATPDHWHRQIVTDCCNAGKDVYCEKPMTHRYKEGYAMIAAEQKNKRIVQVGSQRRSSVVYEKA